MLLLSAASKSAVAQHQYSNFPGDPAPAPATPVECYTPPPSQPSIVTPPVVTPPAAPPPPAPDVITRDRGTRAPLPGMPGAKKSKSLLDP